MGKSKNMRIKAWFSSIIFLFCTAAKADINSSNIDWKLINKELSPPIFINLSKYYPEQTCKSNITSDLILLRRCRVELEEFRNQYLEPYNIEALKYLNKISERNEIFKSLRKNNKISIKEYEKINLKLTILFEMFEKSGRIMQPYFEHTIKLRSTAKWVVPEIKALELQQLQFGTIK